jgi:hypothetical protein
MRTMALLVALGAAAGCTDDPSVRIVAPLPDTTVVASVELRMEGHHLQDTTQTKIYLDLQPYSDLIENSLPDECGSCMFTIAFAGASITNGMHEISVYMYEGETQIADDTISLKFQR